MEDATDERFFGSVLDSLTEQIAVIDVAGRIQWVNRSWIAFSDENGGHSDRTWRAANYLAVCGNSANLGDEEGDCARAGIEAVIRGEAPAFYFEYPCHSPTVERWFMMRVCPLENPGTALFVVTHQNITERKLAELRVEDLAILDGLTGIANRRRFDEFLCDEWRRAQRLGHAVSLALFDIDHFKPYNDHYGHVAGDECLRRVGAALDDACRRPGDLVARYGGEEFAVILGSTEMEPALELAGKIRLAIEQLHIPHAHATAAGCVTLSGGVASLRPAMVPDASPLALVEAADEALYGAKESGRNRVCVAEAPGAATDRARSQSGS